MLMVVDMCWVIDDTQEDRYRVARQLRPRESCERGEIEGLACFVLDLQRCAAGAAFVVGQFDTVDICFADAGELADYFGNFGRGAGRVS